MCKICKWDDWGRQSTRYYIKYIYRAFLANLQRRTLKLGRLIVLKNTPTAIIYHACYSRKLTWYSTGVYIWQISKKAYESRVLHSEKKKTTGIWKHEGNEENTNRRRAFCSFARKSLVVFFSLIQHLFWTIRARAGVYLYLTNKEA